MLTLCYVKEGFRSPLFFKNTYFSFQNYARRCSPHSAENRIMLPPVGHVWWVNKGHMNGHSLSLQERHTAQQSTCAVLSQRIRNASLKSEALQHVLLPKNYFFPTLALCHLVV